MRPRQMERIGTSITILTAALLAYSVVYDYVYFASLDMQLSEVPTSIQDHARTALIWTPALAFVVAVIFLFWQFHRNSSEEGDEAERPSARRIFKQHWSLILMIPATILAVLFDRDLSMLFVAALLALILNIALTVYRKSEKYLISNKISIFFLTAILMLTMVSAEAYSAAKKFTKNEEIWEIEFVSERLDLRKKYSGIRRFSEFSLLADGSDAIVVVPNDEILATKRAGVPLGKQRNICKWVGVLCESP